MSAECFNCRYYVASNSSRGRGDCRLLESLPLGYDLLILIEESGRNPRITKYDGDVCDWHRPEPPK